MNIKDLENLGGFILDELVPKTKTWHMFDENGNRIDYDAKFFVRQASFIDFRRASMGIDPENIETVKENPEAMLIALCVRLGKNGEERLTYDMACRLTPSLFMAFKQGVDEVYSMGKPSAPKKSSGASSSQTASAAKPSVKRKKA